jgi:hypothetical protein
VKLGEIVCLGENNGLNEISVRLAWRDYFFFGFQFLAISCAFSISSGVICFSNIVLCFTSTSFSLEPAIFNHINANT